MLKEIQVQLYLPEQSQWHGDFKKHWCSSGVFIVNFEIIPHLSISLLNLGNCCKLCYQQRSKYRQVKITKHTSTCTIYAIFTGSNYNMRRNLYQILKIMQIVGFEQTLQNLLRFSFRKNNFCIGKKTIVEFISVAVNDSSDVLCFYLCLINLLAKSMKTERCTAVMFKLLFICYCWRFKFTTKV